jgi:hypothetical protein
MQAGETKMKTTQVLREQTKDIQSAATQGTPQAANAWLLLPPRPGAV